jgi:hypothetical protein
MNSGATKVAAQLAAGAVAVHAPDPGAGGGRGAGELGLVDAEPRVAGVGVVEAAGDQRPGAKTTMREREERQVMAGRTASAVPAQVRDPT